MFRVKDINDIKLKVNEDPEKKPSFPDLSNTPTDPNFLDFPDLKQTQDRNINNPIETHILHTTET